MTTSIIEAEKRTRETERILSNIYEKIYGQIEKDPDYPSNVENLRSKYEDKVYSVTRKALEEINTTGSEYVGSKLKHDIYTTDSDLENIKKNTDMAVERFFGNVKKGAERQNQKDYQDDYVPEDTPYFNDTYDHLLNIYAALKGLAVSIATVQLAQSIIGKGKALTYGQSNVYIVWVTQHDEMVCPICRPLHNKVFNINDPNVPTPGVHRYPGTHERCRCYYKFLS